MREAPDISYIIPCYQCRRTVGRTIRSLQEQRTKLKKEIIIVDSSPQPVQEWIRMTFPRVKVIASEDPLWPGAARNRGADAARAPLLAFIDADAAALPDWTRKLERRLEEENVFAAGGSVINGNPQYLASRVQYWIEFSEFRRQSPAGFRPYLSSSNMLMAAATFHGTGGFPEDLQMSEDMRFSQKLGRGLLFEPTASIEHLHRSRWKDALLHLNRLGYWSGILRRTTGGQASWLAHFPTTGTLLLIPYRLARILARIYRGPIFEGISATLLVPFITAGLWAWARGFRAGLKGL